MIKIQDKLYKLQEAKTQDKFYRAQEIGIYHMYVFYNIEEKQENSKIINDVYRLSKKIYNDIKTIEENKKSKILVSKDLYLNYIDNFEEEPFITNKYFGFTAYRDSIDYDTVYNLYLLNKDKYNINSNFELYEGYYESNNIENKEKLCYRNDAMGKIIKYNKENDKEYEKLIKKMEFYKR